MDIANLKMKRTADSLFTKIFARSISFHISPLLADTNIKPIQVTVLGLLLGLGAAWLASQSGWTGCMVAAILLEASHVLDCVDGELARLTDRGSPFAAVLDPISDRIKDMALIYAAYIASSQSEILTLSQDAMFSIAFFSMGIWLLYMYIVDAYLNPSRNAKTRTESPKTYRVYLGLYDLFIYGSIIFLLLNIFEFFNFYILSLGTVGVIIQTIRLGKALR